MHLSHLQFSGKIRSIRKRIGATCDAVPNLFDKTLPSGLRKTNLNFRGTPPAFILFVLLLPEKAFLNV